MPYADAANGSSSSNAFTDPPRLPIPPKYIVHSRSVSRSPVRQHARDFDPMLRDLSPTTTLRAFVTDPNDLNESTTLTTSIRTSSASERALGAKAAQACLDLRTWTREMEAWQWPGTFDIPEPARKKMRMSNTTFTSVISRSNTIASTHGGEGEDEEFWGSLPARTVQTYERRADEIGQRLDEIDVEELKEYVLASHYRSESRPASRDDRFSSNGIVATDMKRLDDFMALVTATILQALPYLSRLNRLLDIWTIRLIILRSASKYLTDLTRARTDLDHGWAAIAVSQSSDQGPTHAKFDRQTMEQMKRMIEQQVGSLGRRLDRFLDELEGRDDTVPGRWIDDFESLETAYGSWVVQAERRVLENEWRVNHPEAEKKKPENVHLQEIVAPNGNSTAVSELEDPILDSDAVARPSIDVATALASKESTPEPLSSRLDTPWSPDIAATDDGSAIADMLAVSDVPSRSTTPNSLTREDSVGQVAKRRAAFLNDIEVNNSLKRSKPPPVVRPFEHASNAFTRLFKKDRSPEQVRPKRSVSSKLGDDQDSASPIDRKPLTPLSAASSKWNTSEKNSPLLSSSTRSFSGGPTELDQDQTKNVDPRQESQKVKTEALSQPVRRTRDVKADKFDVSERPTPRTYRPTGLSSPFHSPKEESFPENWPLGPQSSQKPSDSKLRQVQKMTPNRSRAEPDSGPEIDTPSALGTEAFDRMFVQSLPKPDAPKEKERPASAKGAEKSSPWAWNRKRAASLPRNRGNATYLDMVSGSSALPSAGRRSSSTSSTQQRPTSSRSREPPMPGFMKSLRNRSTSTGSRPRSSRTITDDSFPIPSPPARPVAQMLKLPSSDSTEDDNERPALYKRASTTSIEAFPRSELKSINVNRSSRQGSASDAPPTPKVSDEYVSARQSEPMSYKGLVAFPSPPPRGASLSGHSTPPQRPRSDTGSSLPIPDDIASSPTNGGTTPLNAAITKRRGKSNLRSENSKPNSPNSPSPNKKSSRFTEAEDTFDRHVSEVLESLPGQIRFKARAGAETPVPRVSDVRGYNAPRPKALAGRPAPKSGTMTIVPAESSPKKSSSASDPEVKLYHLTQAGCEEPIKLFVRLVGESERVMVRVGGGWADLADYLREYAEHHGSRTVSEGLNGLEVQTMPGVNSAHTRRVSGPVEFRAKTPAPGTPTNGTPRPGSNDSEKDWFATRNAGTPGEVLTPTSTHGSSSSSRPSTGGASNLSRPSSRQGNAEAIGLGGGSGKKTHLTEHKAKWVEGMIERAKKASAEKSKEDGQKYFGELGKAGGTRRVIFRSSSGIGDSGGKGSAK